MFLFSKDQRKKVLKTSIKEPSEIKSSGSNKRRKKFCKVVGYKIQKNLLNYYFYNLFFFVVKILLKCKDLHRQNQR